MYANAYLQVRYIGVAIYISILVVKPAHILSSKQSRTLLEPGGPKDATRECHLTRAPGPAWMAHFAHGNCCEVIQVEWRPQISDVNNAFNQ